MISPRRFITWFRLCALLIVIGSTHSVLYGQDDEAEARRLYAVGKVALKDNNLDIAARNFERAAALAPKNALIRLNLAIVQNKLDKVSDASQNLEQALAIGLDGDSRTQAEELQAELEYKRQKQNDGVKKQSDELDQTQDYIQRQLAGLEVSTTLHTST
jgi:tetratricopeptide (TPR) repeat protein